MGAKNSEKTARRRLPAISSRGRGQGSVVRGRVVKRRGEPRAARTVQAEREAAAATALERKKEEMRGAINNMTEDKVRELLLMTVEREPSLMQDVLDMIQPATDPQPVPVTADQPEGSDPAPVGDNPDLPWCTCTFCREMPQPEENICCGKQPQQCLSRLAQFQLLVLDEDVLDIARLYRQDVLAVPAEEDRNKGRRHAGYRQFTLWQHGRLGAGNRRVIPSCCVWNIRTKYPDRFGQYTGFIPGRLG